MAERAHGQGVYAGRVAAVLAGLALVVLGCAAGVHALATWWDAPLAGPGTVAPVQIPQPQLESAPQIDRAQYFAEKDTLLHEYRWIDREKGVARIPIEDAMRLLAHSGEEKR